MLANTVIKINEIFFSLQGESSRIGLPTVFIRLTGCPMRCNYCDTAYAFNGGENLTIHAILAKVASYKTQYITVTGGEPLAQRECLDLLTTLCDSSYEVSLETGGALTIKDVDPRVKIILDIKTPGSGEVKNYHWPNLNYLKAKDEIKLVITDHEDYIINLSKKYILLVEYYSSNPVGVRYRGNKDKLFKRDFAGEMIKKYNLNLIDYGFVYRFDKNPQDDLTWFLLKKKR